MKRLPLIIFALFFLAYDVLAAPQHSIDLGNTWMCKNGYKKVENSCKKIFVPENALAVFDTWMCKHGFKKIGNECAKISVLPKNAIGVGDRWQCKPAFKRLGDNCVEKTYGELVQTIDLLVGKQ